MTTDPHHDPTDDARAGRSTGPHVHHEAQDGWNRSDDGYLQGGVIRDGFMRLLPEDARQYLEDRDEQQRLGRLVEEVRDGGHTVQVGRVMIAPCDEHGRTRAEVTALVAASRAEGERDEALARADAAEQRIRDLTQEVQDERGAARDQMEQVRIRDARIQAVRDVLDAEERAVANLERGACGIGDGWSAAVSVADIRRALDPRSTDGEES